MAKLFGTDGVRGVFGKDLTTEIAQNLGGAGAKKIINKNKGLIIIGRDTRASGLDLMKALAKGACSQGIDVHSVGVLPTPAISFLVRYFRADAGIVVSASHNPAEYNGIKFFDNRGIKLDNDIEDQIEALMEQPLVEAEQKGEFTTRTEKDELHYIDHIVSSVEGDFSGYKVALDCAHGAASVVGPHLFEKLGAQVDCFYCDPNGLNINHNCGSTHPYALEKICKSGKYDIGFSFDGDSDRLIAIDENGNHIDGDFIMAICGAQMKKEGLLKNNFIVTTVMTNLGFYLAMDKLDIKVLQTQVGDKFVLDEMLVQDASLGGEQSGHIIFSDYGPTGDGLITAVKLLEVMEKTGKKLSELATIMKRLPQVLLNVKVNNKDNLDNCKKIWESVHKVEASLNGKGRILVRSSGTESLVRVMIESDEHGQANDLANEVAKVVESELG